MVESTPPNLNTKAEDNNRRPTKQQCFLVKLSNNKTMFVIGILLLLVLVSLGVYYFTVLNKKASSIPIAPAPNHQESEKIYGTNENETQLNKDCGRIIAAVKEYPARYFIACSNNVFDIENGKIIKQWSPEKLVSPKITSMVKINDHLYIGNEGVTSIDLYTGEIKRYDRSNGMEYVGNTIVAADGGILWVGTFGSLYKLDLSTEKLEQITEKVSLSKIGIEDIKVTPRSVYILTQEAVFRHDKNSGQWEKFDESTFGTTPGTLSETVRSQLVFTKEMIVILQPYIAQNSPHNYQLWYVKDMLGAEWQSIPEIITQIEKDYPEVLGYGPGVEIDGYEEKDGSIILKVAQYDDITHYYANPSTKEAGLARNKYHDDYLKTDPEEKYRDFINNVLRNK